MARKVKSKVTFKGELAFPSDYVCAPELKGKDCTVTIQAITKEQVQMSDGGKQSKLIVRLVGTPKKLLLNKTNADSIASLYGTKAETWTGKKITLYPTTCMAFGDMVECIRVREVVPSANGKPPEPNKEEQKTDPEPFGTGDPDKEAAALAEFQSQNPPK